MRRRKSVGVQFSPVAKPARQFGHACKFSLFISLEIEIDLLVCEHRNICIAGPKMLLRHNKDALTLPPPSPKKLTHQFCYC